MEATEKAASALARLIIFGNVLIELVGGAMRLGRPSMETNCYGFSTTDKAPTSLKCNDLLSDWTSANKRFPNRR